MSTLGLLHIAAITAGGLPAAAAADEPPAGFYVAGDVGIQDGGLEAEQGPYDLSLDWNIDIRAGYRLNETWRVEAEAAHRVSDIGEVCYTGFSCFSSDDVMGGDLGDFERTSLHANVLYDLPLGGPAVRPFVGAGIGATRVSLERGSLGGSGDDLAWSGQLIAGAAFAITPRLSLDLTYRYVHVADVKTYQTPQGGAAGQCLGPCPRRDGINVGGGPSGETFGQDQILSIGVRYAFDRPF